MTSTQVISGLLLLVAAGGGCAVVAFVIAEAIRNRRIERGRAERLRWSI